MKQSNALNEIPEFMNTAITKSSFDNILDTKKINYHSADVKPTPSIFLANINYCQISINIQGKNS